MEGVTSKLIFNKMKLEHKKILSKEAMQQWVAEHQPKLLVMCGAGDIDTLLQPVKTILESNRR